MLKRRGIATKGNLGNRARGMLRKVGVARSRDLVAAGLSRTQIQRLLDSGALQRVGRGLYRNPNKRVDERSDLAATALLVPGGVICLLSALRFHGLTTQNPFEVWLAIDRKAWRPAPSHPPLRLFYLSGATLREGVEEHRIGGVTVRVFSAAKTIADCFKFRNRIGTDVAVEALRAYRRKYPKRLDDLWRFARINRVSRVMQPYMEALE